MIKKIMIQNYRIYENFQLEFNPKRNVVVGNNDAGKSTLVEALSIALTNKLNGRSLAQQLSPYFINMAATETYISTLQKDPSIYPPEVIIDVFFENDKELASLRGTNNLAEEESPGIRLRIAFDEGYIDEYKKFAEEPGNVKLVPIEYYKVEWLGFSGNGITWRSVPVTSALIDAADIKLQSGTDFYLQQIIARHLAPKDRVELQRAYRSLREEFAKETSIADINARLGESSNHLTDRAFSLSIDISQRTSWESTLVPHIDDLPFQYLGNGEKNCLKILLAISKAVDTQVILVEEPENHLSYSNLNRLVSRVNGQCQDKQVIVTTHSSYVINKLGLDQLILLTPERGVRLTDLKESTTDYFMKLSGYDTLRMVLAAKAILVEGPSDELIIQRAYLDAHGKLPIEDGVDVISVRGLSAKRFLDIAVEIKKPTTVVNDNDGDFIKATGRYSDYSNHDFISIRISPDITNETLEPQIFATNGLEKLNRIFETEYETADEMKKYMKANKTTCALKIFGHDESIKMPEYINEAVR